MGDPYEQECLIFVFSGSHNVDWKNEFMNEYLRRRLEKICQGKWLSRQFGIRGERTGNRIKEEIQKKINSVERPS